MIKKMSVIFLINSLEGGGAERVFANLVTHASKYWVNYNIKVVLLDSCNEEYSIPDKVEKYTLNSSGSFIHSYLNLRKVLSDLQPDVIFSFLTRSNCAAVLCAGKHKTIISERVNTSSHFSTSLSGYFNKLLVKLLYKKSDHIVAVSKGIEKDLIDNFDVNKKQLSVIYNSYNIEELNKLASQHCDFIIENEYIVSAGRLVHNKNFEMLLNIYARADTNFDLVIMGDGPLKEHLLKLCIELNIDERVHFLGFISNPYPVLSNAKLFISTSNAEGFPNALVEAMAMKLPVLATDCLSGPAEILIKKVNANSNVYIKGKWGYLLPTNNVAEGVHALNDLLKGTNIEHFSEMSRKRAEDFNVEKTMQSYMVTIEDVING